MSVETYNLVLNEKPQHKFQPKNLNDGLRSAAVNYAHTYEGHFEFMVKMNEKSHKAETFSDLQLCAILNCMAREADNYFKKHPEQREDNSVDYDAEFDKVVENFNKTEATPEPTINSDAALDLPVGGSEVLAEINAKITSLQTKLTQIQEGDAISKLQAKVDASSKQEQELFEKFQAAIAEIRETKNHHLQEISQIEQDTKTIQDELDKLAQDKAKAIELLAAQNRLDSLRKQLDEFRSTTVWGEFIKPFQWDDVCFMTAAYMEGKKGVLNANDMGLGKTFESVALISIMRSLFFEKHGRLPTILWLTKKSLKLSTMREFRKWDPEMMAVPVEGNPKQRDFIVELAVQNNSVVVANYEATNTTKMLKNTTWDLVFMDEVHRLKGGANNTPTQIWENARAICHKAEFIVPLSGSPIQNHPKEMWAYLHLLDPVRFPDVKLFERQFCYGYDDGIAVDWNRLIKVLSDQVIRRSKSEVLEDLPDKTREFRYLEMGPAQREIYDMMRTNFFVWLDEQQEKSLTATAIIAQLTRLRQIAVHPESISWEDPVTGETHTTGVNESVKIDEAMDIITELHAAGEPVLLFTSQFNAPLEEVVRRCEKEGIKTAAITGATSHLTDEYERQFNEGEIDVLCINLRTGAEGLNLQARCSYSIFLDLWWNPKHNEQAEDRLWREGQKNAVTIYVLQCEDSVDAYIAAILEEKESMIEGIMEDSSYRKGSDWKEFLENLI